MFQTTMASLTASLRTMSDGFFADEYLDLMSTLAMYKERSWVDQCI